MELGHWHTHLTVIWLRRTGTVSLLPEEETSSLCTEVLLTFHCRLHVMITVLPLADNQTFLYQSMLLPFPLDTMLGQDNCHGWTHSRNWTQALKLKFVTIHFGTFLWAKILEWSSRHTVHFLCSDQKLTNLTILEFALPVTLSTKLSRYSANVN